jgi:HPt (histidine-containing phosphotransfer) domain-containing protein
LAEKPTSAAIELSQLDALTEGNPEFRAELLAIFLDEVPKNLEKAKMAVQAANGEGLYQAAHAMKPSLLLFGLPSAATVVANLEALGKAQANKDEMEAGLQALENIISPALEAVAAL